MSETGKTKAKDGQALTLGDLRAEIDRIDAEIHERLIERGEIIGELINVKGTQDSGAAFRPAREAEMMRRLVQRHRGILPLDTVESIWRVIISTFTYVQASYSVHADMSGGDAAVRDSARFHFGFTVPLIAHTGAGAVIASVAASRGDLGLVPAKSVATSTPWWTALENEKSPKIIARVPFVERSNHPASFPLFVVSRPVEAAVTEVETWSVRVAGWAPLAARAVSALAEALVVPDAIDGAALLLSLPPGRKLPEVTDALQKAGSTVRATALVGGHANRYTV